MKRIIIMFDAITKKLPSVKASDELIAERKAICNSCEKKKTVKISDAWPLMDVCGKCYCPINTKTYLVHTKCPDVPSKW